MHCIKAITLMKVGHHGEVIRFGFVVAETLSIPFGMLLFGNVKQNIILPMVLSAEG